MKRSRRLLYLSPALPIVVAASQLPLAAVGAQLPIGVGVLALIGLAALPFGALLIAGAVCLSEYYSGRVQTLAVFVAFLLFFVVACPPIDEYQKGERVGSDRSLLFVPHGTSAPISDPKAISGSKMNPTRWYAEQAATYGLLLTLVIWGRCRKRVRAPRYVRRTPIGIGPTARIPWRPPAASGLPQLAITDAARHALR